MWNNVIKIISKFLKIQKNKLIILFHSRTGEVYRGKLIEAEDNMNCQMTQITVTYRDGRMATLENVYIRGSKIRFLILPDMLKNAPMFKKQGTKAGTAGRGKSAILRAQGKFVWRYWRSSELDVWDLSLKTTRIDLLTLFSL